MIATALPLLSGTSDNAANPETTFTSHGSIDQLLEAEWTRVTQRPEVLAFIDGNDQVGLRDFANLQRRFDGKRMP